MNGEHAQPSTQSKAGGPDAVILTVCLSCTRNDRVGRLTARHYYAGSLCPGPIKQVVYVRREEEG